MGLYVSLSLSPLPLWSAFKPRCPTESFITLPRGNTSPPWLRRVQTAPWTRPPRLFSFHGPVTELGMHLAPPPPNNLHDTPSLSGGPPGLNSTGPLISSYPLTHPAATSLVPCGSSGLGGGWIIWTSEATHSQLGKPLRHSGLQKHLLCVHLGRSMHEKRAPQVKTTAGFFCASALNKGSRSFSSAMRTCEDAARDKKQAPCVFTRLAK